MMAVGAAATVSNPVALAAGEECPHTQYGPVTIPEKDKDTSEFLAEYITNLSYDDLSTDVVEAAKRRMLDSMGCAIAAIDEPEISIIRKSILSMKKGPCSIIGSRLYASPPEAALLNTGMVRVLDYNDTYVGPHGGGHPSNSIAAVMGCTEFVGGSTKNMLTAIVICYEILGAFADILNTRAHGMDHLGYVGISLCSAMGKALELTPEQLQNALGIMVSTYNPLHVTLAEQITMWKGIATAYGAMNAVHASQLGKNGMIGPRKPFDGHTGWKEVVARRDFELNLTPGERIHNIWTKLYLSETYALSAAEGMIEFSQKHDIDPGQIKSIHVQSFGNAVSRIGATEGRNPYHVTSKPEADHSFPYIISVSLLDKELTHAQYEQKRIMKNDVQDLLKKVTVEENPEFSRQFVSGTSPVPAEIDITMKDGRTYKIRKNYFSGHAKDPATMEQVIDKFYYLTENKIDSKRSEKIIDTVNNIESHKIKDLTRLLQIT